MSTAFYYVSSVNGDKFMQDVFPLKSYGGDPIELVPVIASYDSEGHVKPLYVRINNERYKVESYWIKSNSLNNVNYHCKLSLGGHTYIIVLTHHIRECVWTIPQYAATNPHSV